VTLAPKGLLIEEQRTNLLTYSTDLSTSWNKGTLATWTLNAAIAPDGTMTALGGVNINNIALISTGGSLYRTGITVSASAAYTFSVYVRTQSGTFDDVRLRLSEAGGNNTVSNAFTVTTEWQRLTLTVTTAAGATTISPAIGTNSSGSLADLYIWGAQLEAGAFATSYIPTVASQVTRAADAASMTGANFSNWYNQAEGTLYAEAAAPAAAQTIATISDNTNSNRILLQQGTNVRSVIITTSGVAQAAVSAAATFNEYAKAATAFAANSCQIASNTVLGIEDTTVVLPVVDRVYIGANAVGTSGFLNGNIKKIAYFPRRLANAEIQSITA
jgi:hypothetical protein